MSRAPSTRTMSLSRAFRSLLNWIACRSNRSARYRFRHRSGAGTGWFERSAASTNCAWTLPTSPQTMGNCSRSSTITTPMQPSLRFPIYGFHERALGVPHPSRIAFALELTATFCRKAGPRGRTDILACHTFCGKEELPGRFSVCRMDDDLTFFPHAHAFCAYSIHILQRHMHDAPLARGHGVQPERLARSLHAFRGHARRHAQFFKTQRAIAARIDVNFFMVGRIQTQRPEGEVFERFQNFRAALQKNLFVLAVEIGEHFRVASRSCAFNRNGPHVHF